MDLKSHPLHTPPASVTSESKHAPSVPSAGATSAPKAAQTWLAELKILYSAENLVGWTDAQVSAFHQKLQGLVDFARTACPTLCDGANDLPGALRDAAAYLRDHADCPTRTALYRCVPPFYQGRVVEHLSEQDKAHTSTWG